MWVRVVTSQRLAAKHNIVYGTKSPDISMNRGPGNNEEKKKSKLKIDDKLVALAPETMALFCFSMCSKRGTKDGGSSG